MYALHIVILFTAVMCHASAKTPIENYSLTYECTNDNKIIITGQDKDLYGSIYAVGTGSYSMCKVDKSVNASVVIFTVGDCNVSLPVNITVMHEEQNTTDDMVLGGRNVTMYELKCNNVRRGGLTITKTINIEESNELTINQTHQKEVNTTMKIMGKGGKELRSNPTVIIGEELELIIEGTVGFSFLASSCIATDGTTNTHHSKHLILNGTTQDASLISPFSNHRDQNHTELKASLYAFHFLNKNTVSIICTITVCQDDDISCPFEIHNNTSRRKRSALVQHHTDTLETSFMVINSYTISVDNTDDSNKSGTSTGRRSLTVSLIFCAAFGFARILP